MVKVQQKVGNELSFKLHGNKINKPSTFIYGKKEINI